MTCRCILTPLPPQRYIYTAQDLRLGVKKVLSPAFSLMRPQMTSHSPIKRVLILSDDEYSQPDAVQTEILELTWLGRHRYLLFMHIIPLLFYLISLRRTFQAYFAEFVGTMLLVIFGTAANCQVNLSSDPNVSSAPKGNYTSVGFGFAVGKLNS